MERRREQLFAPVPSGLNKTLVTGVVVTVALTFTAMVLVPRMYAQDPDSIKTAKETVDMIKDLGLYVILGLIGFMVKDSHDAINHRLDEWKNVYSELKISQGRDEMRDELELKRTAEIVSLADAQVVKPVTKEKEE